jgi:hypothetical protein
LTQFCSDHSAMISLSLLEKSHSEAVSNLFRQLLSNQPYM